MRAYDEKRLLGASAARLETLGWLKAKGHSADSDKDVDSHHQPQLSGFRASQSSRSNKAHSARFTWGTTTTWLPQNGPVTDHIWAFGAFCSGHNVFKLTGDVWTGKHTPVTYRTEKVTGWLILLQHLPLFVFMVLRGQLRLQLHETEDKAKPVSFPHTLKDPLTLFLPTRQNSRN